MPASPAIRIDTAHVSGRRQLRFETLDHLLADADQLAAADRAGELQTLGNWSFGQTLNHLATWVDYSFDGAPMMVPFFLRWFGPLVKKHILYKPMRPGSRIPGIPGGTLAIDPAPTEAALAHLHRSFARLQTGPPTRPHLLLGRLTHHEWIQQHLRHAELHLSFLREP